MSEHERTKKIPRARPRPAVGTDPMIEIRSELAEMWTTLDKVETSIEQLAATKGETVATLGRVLEILRGSDDGKTKGIHARFDSFESALKDHEERITDGEEKIAQFDRLREDRNAQMLDHDHRIKANAADIQTLKETRSKGSDRLWGAAAGGAVGAVIQLFSYFLNHGGKHP